MTAPDVTPKAAPARDAAFLVSWTQPEG